VVGKAVTNARIGRVSALSGFAKRMYQMITDSRLSKMLMESKSSIMAESLARRKELVDMAIPASVTMQSSLFDNLSKLCTAFSYIEAKSCEINVQNPFSM